MKPEGISVRMFACKLIPKERACEGDDGAYPSGDDCHSGLQHPHVGREQIYLAIEHLYRFHEGTDVGL